MLKSRASRDPDLHRTLALMSQLGFTVLACILGGFVNAYRLRRQTTEGFKHLFVWLVLLSALFPMYMMFNISVKTNKQFFNQPWLPTLPVNLENWSIGWSLLGEAIGVTVFVCISTTALTLVFAVAAAYFFGRYRMPGSNLLWAVFLVLMLMPGVANLIPLFTLLRSLSLLNTLSALVIVGVSGGQVFSVYVLRHFVEDIPEELFDAAQVDGASHLQQVLNIVVPMSGPILATLAILRFIQAWNSFVLPLVVLRDTSKLPIAVRLYQLEGAYVTEWGPLMAAYSIASVPIIIIFLFTMRLFVRGLSAGAIKG